MRPLLESLLRQTAFGSVQNGGQLRNDIHCVSAATDNNSTCDAVPSLTPFIGLILLTTTQYPLP